MTHNMIAILDLGSTQSARIAREIRALGVYSEIHPHDIAPAALKALPGVAGIILNGGPDRMENGEEKDVGLDIYNYDLPVLLVDHRGDAPWPEDELERKNILRGFVFGFCGIEEK